MGVLGDLIARVSAPTNRMAELLLKDITPAQFARKPVGAGGKAIDTNHPAFVYGHLATYPARMLEVCGLDQKLAPVPAGFDDLFAAGKECRDDPEGRIYPPMGAITSAMLTGYRTAVAEVAKLPDERLSVPNPREGRMREMFPTLEGMLVFYVASHPMMHLGQVSAWRRCMGLGSAM